MTFGHEGGYAFNEDQREAMTDKSIRENAKERSYKPIPVDAARQLADDYEKDIVLFVGWDEASNTTNVVTWGRDPVQKQSAAIAGDTIREALKLGETSAQVHEDFRREGEAARVVDELRRRLAAIRELLATIVIDEGEDAGVI